jgi:hypothetical protein
VFGVLVVVVLVVVLVTFLLLNTAAAVALAGRILKSISTQPFLTQPLR